MKKTILLVILTLVISLLVVGCQITPNVNEDNPPFAGTTPENGKNDTIPPESGTENGENDTTPPENGTENGKNDTTPPENGTENGKNDTTPPESGTENEEDSLTDTPPADEKPKDPAPLPEIGTAVGNRFMDLSLTTLNDDTVNTADLRGKIIIFNVWATWCPPCKAELPDFSRIASEYADDVVIIAAHCYDSYMHNMPSYVETNLPDTKIIFAYDNSYSDGYIAAGGVGYVPQTAIIDQNGVIVYSNSGGLSYSYLKYMIDGLLAE